MDKGHDARSRNCYIACLAAGFLALCLPAILDAAWGTGLATAVWIFAFLHATTVCRTGKRLLISGAVFLTGYFLRFLGAAEGVGLYLVLFPLIGLVQYGLFLLYSRILTRFDHLVTTIAFPVLWLIVYFLATLARFPSLVRIDMMFSDINILLRTERVLGSAGLSFALLWIPALLSYAARKRRTGPAAVGAAVCAALFILGAFCAPGGAAGDTVRVAYTTGPYVGDYINYTGLPVETHLESMRSSVRAAADAGAGILAFSEESFEIDDTDEAAFIDACRDAARDGGIHVLLGLDVRDTDDSHKGLSQNKIVWIGSDGEVLGSYLKTMLIPVLESGYEPGSGKIPTHTVTVGDRQINVSYAICYDSNFPSYVKRMDPSTDLLFLPSWDWRAVTGLHAQLCCALAAETRVNILKSTYDGISIAVDPYGRVLYSSDTGDTGYEHISIVDIPIGG